MSRMKTLIIGGEGYIGSFLFNYLNRLDFAVYRYGNRSHDYNKLTSAELNQYNYIIVLAGNSSVPSCNGDLKPAWNNNVRNFSNLIEKLSNKVKVIYASSSSVYGDCKNKVFKETDFRISSYLNNYDLTKIMLDQVALNYILDGHNIVGLRLGTVNGAGPVIRKELLINSMTYSALTNKKIYITNADINRPFLSINDLAITMLSILTSNFVPGIYNLATGNNQIKQYAEAVSALTNAEIIDNGNTPGVYDFMINSDKIIDQYNFECCDSLENVITGLITAYNNSNTKLVARTEYFNYTG